MDKKIKKIEPEMEYPDYMGVNALHNLKDSPFSVFKTHDLSFVMAMVIRKINELVEVVNGEEQDPKELTHDEDIDEIIDLYTNVNKKGRSPQVFNKTIFGPTFNAGDEVWFMIKNKAERGVIESENEHHAMVKREVQPTRCIKISRIFKTKEELIESLFN